MFMPSGAAAAAGFILFAELIAEDDGNQTGFVTSSVGSFEPVEMTRYIVWVMKSNNINATMEFSLLGINIPDSDVTFRQLEITGTFDGGTNPRTEIFLRTDAAYLGSVPPANSQWLWPFNNNNRFVDTEVYDFEWVF